jgi:hypothetical protein
LPGGASGQLTRPPEAFAFELSDGLAVHEPRSTFGKPQRKPMLLGFILV